MTSYVLVVKCPGCEARGQWIRHIPSGYTAEAKIRTDGRTRTNALDLTRCPDCQELFFPLQAERAARPMFLRSLPPASEADYLDALQLELYESREECLRLRVAAWRASNDARGADTNGGPNRSFAAKRNLERLHDQLADDDLDELVLKAETARQLGQFEEALSFLDLLPRLVKRDERIDRVTRLTRARSRAVTWVKLPESHRHLLVCPCGERASTGLGWSSRYPDQEPHPDAAPWLVRCEGCSQVYASGDNLAPAKAERPAILGGKLTLIGVFLALFGTPTVILAVGSLGFEGCQLAGSLAAFTVFAALTFLVGIRLLVRHFRRWPEATLPSQKELLDRVDGEEWTCLVEQRWLRTAAHLARPRVEDARAAANQIVLDSILGYGPHDLVVRAELARRAGRFDEAIRLLEEHPKLSRSPAGHKVYELARAEVSASEAPQG